MSDSVPSRGDIDLFAGEKRVHEIKLARYGDHSSHEHELTVLVAAESEKEAAVKACDLQIEERPEWHTEETSWLHAGSSPVDSAEWRQFIDETQDGVLFGSEVPV
ncbi:hypothetical protein [Halosimplex sp. J119]